MAFDPRLFELLNFATWRNFKLKILLDQIVKTWNTLNHQIAKIEWPTNQGLGVNCLKMLENGLVTAHALKSQN